MFCPRTLPLFTLSLLFLNCHDTGTVLAVTAINGFQLFLAIPPFAFPPALKKQTDASLPACVSSCLFLTNNERCKPSNDTSIDNLPLCCHLDQSLLNSLHHPDICLTLYRTLSDSQTSFTLINCVNKTTRHCQFVQPIPSRNPLPISTPLSFCHSQRQELHSLLHQL